MGTRFKPNPLFEQEMRRNPKYGEAMEDRAQRIADKATANGGRFTKGYKATRTSKGARAGTDHPFAHWDEWGSRFRRPRAPLRRALSSLGLLGRTKIR